MSESMEQLEKVTQGLIQACDEMNANCSKSVDAMMEATSVVSKGCEELSRNFGTLVQESMAQTMSAGKTMMGAKSVKELTELQSAFLKTFFDSWLTGAGQLSEISARVTQKAFEPVAKHANDTLSKVVQKAQQSAAA